MGRPERRTCTGERGRIYTMILMREPIVRDAALERDELTERRVRGARDAPTTR